MITNSLANVNSVEMQALDMEQSYPTGMPLGLDPPGRVLQWKWRGKNQPVNAVNANPNAPVEMEGSAKPKTPRFQSQPTLPCE